MFVLGVAKIDLVVVISMVRHSPCEDYWKAKMTLLVTNKVAIFLSSLEMSKNTIFNTYESWKIRFANTPAGVHLAVAFINPSWDPRLTVHCSCVPRVV